MVQQKSKETHLKHATPEQFFDVFKSHAYRLRDICRDIVNDIQPLDEKNTWEAVVGQRKWIQYLGPSNKLYKVKDEVDYVGKEPERIISYKILEGAVKDNISKVSLEVKDNNTAIWTAVYNDTEPEDYLNLLDSINKAVDKSFARDN